MKKWVIVFAFIALSSAAYAKGVSNEELMGKWVNEKDASIAIVFEANGKFTDLSKGAVGTYTYKWELLDDEILLLTQKNAGATVLKTFKIKECKNNKMEIKLLFTYDVQKELTTVPEKGAKTSKFIKK
ncbi:MAG: hypothetical protein A2Y33_10695 [Spirochaetes bacterium GWF1_51_8]|nr:MAG: hypothetical protein A2Y33_10695 [Spirochaetes bacterium GWF1_51_8]